MSIGAADLEPTIFIWSRSLSWAEILMVDILWYLDLNQESSDF